MTTQFDKIYHGLSPDVGKFRVAESGMAWKAETGEQTVSIPKSEIKWAQWLRVARNFQLRVGKANHQTVTFDGFLREDHDRVAKILKTSFAITLETKDISFKGWNWGITDFQGPNKLAFMVSDRTAFELPLDKVGNTNIAGKTEVSLEFNPPSNSKKVAGDEMVEIRFHVPGTTSKNKGSGSDVEEMDDDEEQSAAQAFHETIKDKADIGQIQGDVIVSFEDVLVLTPRGRYDMDMFSDFLRLRGKTYDYKILHTSISRMFLLPKDDLHVLFILGLDVPIRQGQTRYQYLVMQFSREEETTAELNMAEEEIEKYDRLRKNYEDPTFEVISGVFRALAAKKITGVGTFSSHSGHPGYKANLKAVQGDLFILEKYIFFVSKSPLLIEISEIHSVVFSRVGAGVAAARTFDLRVITKSGPEHVFSSINKEEHEPTENFLKEKKVKVKNEMADADILMAAAVDDEDEDMQSVASDDSSPRGKKPMFDDDEDSEVDEDFKASGSDSGSPSDSDSSSGGAATASDASGDRDFKVTKKKKKTKGKEKAKGDADTAAAESDADDDKPKKKAAPKPKAKKKSEDDMDVDVEVVSEKPKPKPKAKPKPKKADGEQDEPPKKKPKKADGEQDEPPKKKLKKSD